LKGKKRITLEERKVLKEKKNRKREVFEKSNCGGFELIYPSENVDLMAKYEKYMDGAHDSINQH